MRQEELSPSRQELDVLRAREARYSALVENSPYCIHEIGHDGRLVSMNPAGLAMADAADECEVIGMRYLDFVGAEDRERIEGLLADAVEGHCSEFEFTAVNGRSFRSNFVPLPDRAGCASRMMGISQDITERRALESDLEQSRKLDAIGRLAGGVAHDFNNLLTVILGTSELLGENLQGADAEDLAQITRAAQRASELTGQLLTFARRRMVQPRLVRLGKHLRDTEPFLRRLLTENVALELHVDADEALPVLIDPGQLDQVLINLVANARDAMPDGGSLRIAASGHDLSPAAAESLGLEPGRHVRLSVSDSGHGISADDRARVFEPFYSTRGVEGTGLGLATCHGIVVQAHGSIRAQGSEGGGTNFVIHLPFTTRALDAPLEAPAPSSVGPASVLLVEDDPHVRATAARSLRASGHRVIEAASGEEALALMESAREPIDMLVADVVLPGISGRVLAETLLERTPELRVLYSSGYTDDLVLHHGVRDDEVHFLPKPYTPTTLTRKVSEVLGLA